MGSVWSAAAAIRPAQSGRVEGDACWKTANATFSRRTACSLPMSWGQRYSFQANTA